MASKSTLDINNEPDSDFYSELGYQGIGFHESVGEIIDNGISASIDDDSHFQTGNPKDSFHIRIYLRKKGNFVHVTVGDDGKGMDKDIIENHLFKPGHKDKSAQGILNEHGMGLKHSLSALNGNDPSHPFEIITRTEDMDQDDCWCISGPLGKEDGDLGGYRDEWEKNMKPINSSNSGTRVHLRVPFETFNTAYLRANKFKSVLPGLYEHLGVMYRKFLQQTSSNIIEVAWETDSDRDEYEVEPIFPEFRDDQDERKDPPRDWYEEDTIKFIHEGDQYSVEYNRGIADWEKTRKKYTKSSNSFPGKSSGDTPFREYYKNNRKTQGIDLVYRGRTLKTGLMGEIWENDKYSQHDRFNKFVGEIVINDPDFRTVFNKTDIDTDTGIWRSLKQAINDSDRYIPRAYGKDEQEDSLRVQIRDWADGTHGTDYAEDHHNPGWGIQLDVIQVKEKDPTGQTPVVIYEAKKGQAGPQAVYQCLLYWDAYKHHMRKKHRLEDVILIAKDFSPSAKQIRKWYDGRDDNHGGQYSLGFKKLSSIPGISL